MALVYFVDDNNDPASGANAYCEVSLLDAALAGPGLVGRWIDLTTPEKETAIKNLTTMVDAIYDFDGEVVDPDEQDDGLALPRKNMQRDISVDQQKKIMNLYFIQQMEWALTRMPHGVLLAKQGNQETTPPQAFISPLAFNTIRRLLR